MIKRGLALSLVLGLASIVQADAVLEIDVPAHTCPGTVTVELFLKQSPVGDDALVRLVQLNADATDPALTLSNFQWNFGAVGHYKDSDFTTGPAGVSAAYYYENSADLGPNPAAQLNLPGDGTRVSIATLDVTVPGVGPYTLDLVNAGGDNDTSGVVSFGFGLDPVPDDDPVTYWRANEADLTGGNYSLCGLPECSLVAAASAPPDEGSLWRSASNTIRLTFDCGAGTLTAPVAGEIEIKEMLAGGGYGADLSSSFTYTVEGGNVLLIRENGAVLTHRSWYAIQHNGWSVVPWGPGDVQYVVQVGDANSDGRVQFNDLSFINASIPTDPAADDAREDINGDARVQFNDLSAANSSIPSDTVAKPAGHP